MDLMTAPPRSSATGVLRLVTGEIALRRWAVASLVANILIVVTGGVVRLTASGLGCPTWPRCTEDAYVAHPALGLHGAIEFGNRLLTFVLIAIAVLTWVTAMRTSPRPRRGTRRIATAMALGIPGDSVMAVMIGSMIIWGITPGPTLFSNRPDLVVSIAGIMLIATLLSLALSRQVVWRICRIVSSTRDVSSSQAGHRFWV